MTTARTGHLSPEPDPVSDELRSSAPSRLSRRTLVVAGVAAGAAIAPGNGAASFSLLTGTEAPIAPPSHRMSTPVPTAEPAIDDTEFETFIASIAAAGIAVYADAGDTEPLVAVDEPGPYRLLEYQAQALLFEASAGGGVQGFELDELVGLPAIRANTSEQAAEGATAPPTTSRPLEDRLAAGLTLAASNAGELSSSIVPPSSILAGYLAATESPGADLARRYMSEVDPLTAELAIFPGLVPLLFAAEIAREDATLNDLGISTRSAPAKYMSLAAPTSLYCGDSATAWSQFTSGSTSVEGTLTTSASVAAQSGPCSQVQSFIDNTLNAIFAALRPSLGSSLPGQILGGVIDFLLASGKVAVRELLNTIIAPVLSVIRSVSAIVGTASIVVSTIRPWTVIVTPRPIATRFSVGSEAPIIGDVLCKVDLGGLDEWPPAISDCAAAGGVPLPSLRPEGAPVVWEVLGTQSGLVTPFDIPSVLLPDATATLRYFTGNEDEETARGEPVSGVVTFNVTVSRPQINELRDTLVNLLFAQLPPLASQLLRPILGPQINNLLQRLVSLADSRGSRTLAVVFHTPPDPTPTPEPPEAEDFAGSFSGRFDFADENIDGAIIQQFLEVGGATCDGESWDGEARWVSFSNVEPLMMDLDQTLPLSIDFAGGSTATTTAGPFRGSAGSPTIGTSADISWTIDLQFSLARTADGEPATITVSGTGTVIFDGEVFAQDQSIGSTIATISATSAC